MRLFPSAFVSLLVFGSAVGEWSRAEPPPSSELLRNADGANDGFSGVGQFRATLTCTGSLIDPSGSGAPDAKAWLLTAGHCISLEPYGVILNQPSTASVIFNFFSDTPDRRVAIRARTVGWATMKGVDLALIELNASLGELGTSGIRPVRLSEMTAKAGRAVFWTGISLSPIPTDMQFLRRGRCTLGQRVQLMEGSWFWTGDFSNDCPDLYGGASGSPLFDAESGAVIGVIGTSTLLNFEQGPDYDCQVNRPCLARAGGPVMQRDTSYASPVQGIAGCFDQTNGLDVRRPGCPLDPGDQLTVRSGSIEVPPVAGGKPAAWDTALSGNQRFYAYKHFPMGMDDCRNPAAYSAPIPLAGAPMIADPVGNADGYYFLCVIAGDTPSFDSSWQQPAHASVRFKRLDSQPPLLTIDYELEQLQGAYRLTNGTGGGGTSGLGPMFFKRGFLSSTDCSDPQDYRVQTSIPQIVRTSEFPVRICWKSSDKAGNYAEPAAFDFGPPAILPNAMRNGASLERGAVAAGSVFRLDTFNLTDRGEYSAMPVATLAGVQMSLLDSGGQRLPVLMTTAGPLFVEGVIPDSSIAGPANLIVQPPQGPLLSQPVEIRGMAPGIYFETFGATPRGYAYDAEGNLYPLAHCQFGQGCFITHLPVSSTPGGLDIVLYATGLRAASGAARLQIGTYTLDSVEIHRHPDYAGVDELHFHLAPEFPLRLFQSIAVETSEQTSNHLWIYVE